GKGLGGAGLPLDRERHSPLRRLGDAGPPFARSAVEYEQLRPLAEPHHIAEVIGLARIEIHCRLIGERLADKQARKAFGWPGWGRGHEAGLAGARTERQTGVESQLRRSVTSIKSR